MLYTSQELQLVKNAKNGIFCSSFPKFVFLFLAKKEAIQEKKSTHTVNNIFFLLNGYRERDFITGFDFQQILVSVITPGNWSTCTSSEYY